MDIERIKSEFVETMKNTSPSQFTRFVKLKGMTSNDPVEKYFWDCTQFTDAKYPFDTTEKIYLLEAAEFFYGVLYHNVSNISEKIKWNPKEFPIIYFRNKEYAKQYLLGWCATSWCDIDPDDSKPKHIKLNIFELFRQFNESFHSKRSSFSEELKKQSNNDFEEELL